QRPLMASLNGRTWDRAARTTSILCSAVPASRAYSARTLRRWANHIITWLEASKTVYVYFDNDQKSAATKDARLLAPKLSASSLRETAKQRPDGALQAGANITALALASVFLASGLILVWAMISSEVVRTLTQRR